MRRLANASQERRLDASFAVPIHRQAAASTRNVAGHPKCRGSLLAARAAPRARACIDVSGTRSRRPIRSACKLQRGSGRSSRWTTSPWTDGQGHLHEWCTRSASGQGLPSPTLDGWRHRLSTDDPPHRRWSTHTRFVTSSIGPPACRRGARRISRARVWRQRRRCAARSSDCWRRMRASGPRSIQQPGSDPATGSIATTALSLQPGTRLGPVPDRRRARRRRHGRSLQGARYAPRSHGRDQSPIPRSDGRSDRRVSDSIARRARSLPCRILTSARCYDIGHQDGVDFLVMEFLDGETLAARLGAASCRSPTR